MKDIAFVSSVLTGYGAISLGVLKILWRQFGVHFYASAHVHAPQASPLLDSALIALLIGGGLLLIIVRHVVPVLLTVLAVTLFEFTMLHHDTHDFWQVCLVIGILTGQIMTLFFNLIANYAGQSGAHRPRI